MTRSRLRPGFSLIELMVTIAVIGFMMVLALPSLGNASRVARERGLVQQFVQDFTWARGAAGAGDASTLLAGASGNPTLVVTLAADCHWTTTVNGVTDTTHSTTLTQVNSQASGIACTSAAVGATPALVYPITFTFTPQGYVSSSGYITITGASTQDFKLNVLSSGSIIQGKTAS